MTSHSVMPSPMSASLNRLSAQLTDEVWKSARGNARRVHARGYLSNMGKGCSLRRGWWRRKRKETTWQWAEDRRASSDSKIRASSPVAHMHSWAPKRRRRVARFWTLSSSRLLPLTSFPPPSSPSPTPPILDDDHNAALPVFIRLLGAWSLYCHLFSWKPTPPPF